MDSEEILEFLKQKKYNPVYLNGHTVSQINQQYEKCLTVAESFPADLDEIIIEEGEWMDVQESLNNDEIPIS